MYYDEVNKKFHHLILLRKSTNHAKLEIILIELLL